MSPVDQAEALGYAVAPASTGIFHVEGFGMALYLHEDDTGAWQQLIDSHEERAARTPDSRVAERPSVA